MKKFFWKRSAIVFPVLMLFIVAPVWIAARPQHPTPAPPKPMPSPNAPKSQNVPQGLEGTPTSNEKPKYAVDQENQQEIRMQVQRLYAMVTEMKDEVDRTDTNAVLSVSVLKRAQEIEKLAKQIKERAKR
jgi:Spy/CpxP family protein refolding chaperone